MWGRNLLFRKSIRIAQRYWRPGAGGRHLHLEVHISPERMEEIMGKWKTSKEVPGHLSSLRQRRWPQEVPGDFFPAPAVGVPTVTLCRLELLTWLPPAENLLVLHLWEWDLCGWTWFVFFYAVFYFFQGALSPFIITWYLHLEQKLWSMGLLPLLFSLCLQRERENPSNRNTWIISIAYDGGDHTFPRQNL